MWSQGVKAPRKRVIGVAMQNVAVQIRDSGDSCKDPDPCARQTAETQRRPETRDSESREPNTEHQAQSKSRVSMALPPKLQTNIMSWVGDNSTPPSDTALPHTGAYVTGEGDRQPNGDCTYPCLSPADLFSLSNAAAAAGSPCVVIKDRFLGREQALRAYEGELWPSL